MKIKKGNKKAKERIKRRSKESIIQDKNVSMKEKKRMEKGKERQKKHKK